MEKWSVAEGAQERQRVGDMKRVRCKRACLQLKEEPVSWRTWKLKAVGLKYIGGP